MPQYVYTTNGSFYKSDTDLVCKICFCKLQKGLINIVYNMICFILHTSLSDGNLVCIITVNCESKLLSMYHSAKKSTLLVKDWRLAWQCKWAQRGAAIWGTQMKSSALRHFIDFQMVWNSRLSLAHAPQFYQSLWAAAQRTCNLLIISIPNLLLLSTLFWKE